MEEFIENFRNQLEDINIEIYPELDFVNSDFWDSLTAITIQMMVEDEYDLKVDIKEISSFKSIEEFYSFIQAKK